MIILTKEKWNLLIKLFVIQLSKVIKERDKYKQMYYDNVDNTENLIRCLSDGSYAQSQYIKQREINQRLIRENKRLKNINDRKGSW